MKSRYDAIHLELLGMRLATDLKEFVLRQRQTTSLQQLLEIGLGILERTSRIELLQTLPVELLDNSANSLETPIQKNRSKTCLDGIGEDGRPALPTAFEFPLAQA